MLSVRSAFSWLPHALLGAMLAVGQGEPASAQDRQPGLRQDSQPGLRTVQAPDCYAVGERVAAEQGGQLARAASRNQNGQTVCVIVVLVPGRDGERPRRTEIVVPAQ